MCKGIWQYEDSSEVCCSCSESLTELAGLDDPDEDEISKSSGDKDDDDDADEELDEELEEELEEGLKEEDTGMVGSPFNFPR